MPEDSLTLAKLQELYERVQRECPPPDRYELRVHSLLELEHALHATGTSTSIAALESAGVSVFVSHLISPWKGVLFNVSAWDRVTDEWMARRLLTRNWLERVDECISIIDLRPET